MTSRHPTMREVLTNPGAHWSYERAPTRERGRRVVTLSRQPGAGGEELARVLGQRLGLQVYDREIIHKIAAVSHVSEPAVACLDEKPRATLTDWLCSFDADSYLSPHAYFEHLTHVVRAIAQIGGAVIVGRGAHLILGPGEALRVLAVAPLRLRISAIAERDAVDLREAERRIAAAEAERSAFLSKLFHVDPADQTRFDLVVNTAALGVDAAAEAICATLDRTLELRAVPSAG